MENSEDLPQKWYQIVIDGSLPHWGDGIWEIIEKISKKICAKFGVMEYLEGHPKKGKVNSFLALEEMQWEPVDVVDLLRYMESVGDLDWGDFYLFHQKPWKWEWEPQEDFATLVGHSDTTIRVIDGNLFYIHTPYKEVVEMIKEAYGSVESIKFSELEFHTYPY